MLIVANYDGTFMIHLRNLTQNTNKYAIGKRPTLDVVYRYIDFFPFSKMDGVWMMGHFFIAILFHSWLWYLDMYKLLTIHMHTHQVPTKCFIYLPTIDNSHVHFSVV